MILEEMHVRSIPVVLGADAHTPQRVAADYVTALELLREIGFGSVSFFLKRERQEVSIERALASLQNHVKV